MSRLLQSKKWFVLAGCRLAAAPGGSSLPMFKMQSPAALFSPTPGMALPRHGQFTPHPIRAVLMGHRLNCVKFVARGLDTRPARRALCSYATAAGNDGGINAGGELAEAKKRLVKAERELDAVKDVLRKAEEAVPVDAQRVAEAKLSVAKAELGVAKAELGVAEAKWQAALGEEKVLFLSSVNTALKSLETAQESVKTANMAYAKVINAPTATPQQGDATPPQETWVVLDLQANGRGLRSPTTIAIPSSKKILLVDGLKKAAVQQFLKGVNACDLIVSATSGGDGFSADLAVETLSCGKSIKAPLFIRLPAKPEPLSPPMKNVVYVKENFYTSDDEAPKVPETRSVSIKGQQGLDRFLDRMQAGGMVADSDRKIVTSDFDGLREDELYWLETRDSLTQSVKGLDAWTKNQDIALEDEVTRSVLAFGNATYGGGFVCLPDLRDVTRKKQFRVGGEQNYVEWDGVLCNGTALLLVEAKQKVVVNLASHNSSGQRPSKAGGEGDTLDLVLGKMFKFVKALRKGELENKDFEQLQGRKFRVFLGARLFSESAKEMCLREGVHPVFSSGNSFCVDTRTPDVQ